MMEMVIMTDVYVWTFKTRSIVIVVRLAGSSSMLFSDRISSSSISSRPSYESHHGTLVMTFMYGRAR